MQLSMLVLWLLELMLRKLGSLKDAGIQPDNPQYRTSWDVLNRFTEQKRIMVQSSKAQKQFKFINYRNFVWKRNASGQTWEQFTVSFLVMA